MTLLIFERGQSKFTELRTMLKKERYYNLYHGLTYHWKFKWLRERFQVHQRSTTEQASDNWEFVRVLLTMEHDSINFKNISVVVKYRIENIIPLKAIGVFFKKKNCSFFSFVKFVFWESAFMPQCPHLETISISWNMNFYI